MSAPGARLEAVLLALALCVYAPPAAAEEAQHVALADGVSPELGRKLRAEIAYAGFGALPAASAKRTPATLRVLSPERVQLSVQRASDGAGFTETLERAPGEGDSFALRIVEALRARLVDVGWTLPEPAIPRAEHAAAPATSAPPPADAGAVAAPFSDEAGATAPLGERSPQPPAAELGLWLGAGVMGSWAPGGLGATPHAALSARIELGRVWGGTLLAELPLLDGEIEAGEGEARIAWSAFSAILDHHLAVTPPWSCSVGLGAALFVLDAAGEAQPQFSGRRERLTVGAGLLALGIGRELTDWLRVRALGLAGVAAPRPVLRFDGREVASLGRVVASLGLQLELGWARFEERFP